MVARARKHTEYDVDAEGARTEDELNGSTYDSTADVVAPGSDEDKRVVRDMSAPDCVYAMSAAVEVVDSVVEDTDAFQRYNAIRT